MVKCITGAIALFSHNTVCIAGKVKILYYSNNINFSYHTLFAPDAKHDIRQGLKLETLVLVCFIFLALAEIATKASEVQACVLSPQTSEVSLALLISILFLRRGQFLSWPSNKGKPLFPSP